MSVRGSAFGMERGLLGYLAAAFAAATTVALFAASQAGASAWIGTNAHGIDLKVSRDGHRALVTFTDYRGARRVVASGAINGRPSPNGAPQVRFHLDLSGGGRRAGFGDFCRRYDGPPLPWLVTTCKAPDGSYWALQNWQRTLPDLGFTPWLPDQRDWELHLSHWSGAPAKVEAYTDWVYGGRFHSIFGRVTYQGKPVFGGRSTRYGAPLDAYGRLVYLDTFASRYGRGWKRENSFLLHRGTGIFCYGFYRFDMSRGYPGYPQQSGFRGPGNGRKYRITVQGPGVSPLVGWSGPGLPNYNPSNPAHVDREERMNSLLDDLKSPNDPYCHD